MHEALPMHDLRAYVALAAFIADLEAKELARLAHELGPSHDLTGKRVQPPLQTRVAVAAELELRDRLAGLQRAVALTAAVVASDATELEGSTPTGPPSEGPPNPPRS